MDSDSHLRARVALWRQLWLLLTVIVVPIGAIVGFAMGSLLVVILSLTCGLLGFLVLETML